MTNEHVRVYLGDTIDNDAEQHVLSRLRSDLVARGVPARILANFYTKRRRHQRQIDLFVITPQRATLIELKNFNPSFPLTAGLNGPWQQTLPDGRQRPLDGNGIHQAKECTFSLNDEMRRLAEGGEVPAEKHFYACIDTVVCLYPTIPAGSTIERADHVTVLGYDQLVDRLAHPGPRPGWGDDDWDRLILHLGLYPLESLQAGPAEARRTELEDYCRRFVRGRAQSLHDLIRLSARVDGGTPAPLDLVSHARHGQMAAVVGPSGAGKTHAAAHAAVELARRGHLVVWARCDEYRRKQLSLLLARAVAPYSTVDPRSLIDTAAASGREAVLILDGLNECDPASRAVLLEQLASLRLRHRLGVLVTSTEPVTPVDETVLTEFRTELPTPEQRIALLRSYGAAPRDEHTQGFQTPFELTLVAECAQDLGPAATRAQLYDAFVHRRCGSLRARAVLRQVARLLGEQLSSSLPIGAVVAALERGTEPASSPDAIDDALGSPLLSSEQGRIRFGHDLLGRFLAADELVHRARSGAELAALLDDPRHRDLTDFALDLETQPARRYELLRDLGDEQRLLSGLLGKHGEEVGSRLHADARAVFAAAKASTTGACLETPPVGKRELYTEPWRLTQQLDPFSRALLVAAVRCLDHGLFIKETAALMEVTDERAENTVAMLRASGFRNPITAVVASTFGIPRLGETMLPASVIADALQFHTRWPSRERGDVAAAAALYDSAQHRGWGLLYVTLQLTNAERSEDRALFPEVLAAAWSAGGYHLRLLALETARYMGGAMRGTPEFDLVRDFLSQVDSSNWALNSMLVEALAAFDGIEAVSNLAGIEDEIAAVLAAPACEEADIAAYRIFSSRFEDERVLGPYCEAIDSLSEHDRRRLLTMAARGRSEYSMFGDTLIAELLQLARPDDFEILEILRQEAGRLDSESSFPQETVAVHVLAVQGLATFMAQLPDPDPDLPTAWRLADELILALARGDEQELHEAGARCWPELSSSEAGAAVDVLYNLAYAYGTVQRATATSTYTRLAAAFADEVRKLLAWGLAHPDLLIRTTRASVHRDHHQFIIRELGRLGTRATSALLEPWVADPHLGDEAAAAIRRLRSVGLTTPPATP